MLLPLCGEDPEVESDSNPHGASLSPQRLELQSYMAPPTGRPYPPSGPVKNRGTRVHRPLRGEELEVKLYMASEGGFPDPQTAKGRPEGFGCIRRCGQRNWRFNHSRPPPDGASLFPDRPRHDRRYSGVSAAAWGGAGSSMVHGTPERRPYPPNVPGRTEGTRVSPPLCGEELEVQSLPTPPQGVPIHQAAQAGTDELGCIADVWAGTGGHGASLSPKRPKHDMSDSGVSGAVWGGAASAIVPEPPTGRPYPSSGPRRTGGTQVYPPLCGEEMEIRSYTAPPRGFPIPQTA